MAEKIRSSDNYIWSLNDRIGEGATGSVYKGRDKKTGEFYAIKIFNRQSKKRRIEIQMREYEVLKKLNNENIVNLSAVESDFKSNETIIVMEFCNGENLLSILQNPANAYGLPEKEFLCVLQDIASGLKYLHNVGIVHRDIKPGNIMRHLTEDGRSLFKLIDFGTARELETTEEFTSLCGTEEYLFPDMYERAILKRNTMKEFNASVDLWSVGVTLYHAATGHLPFRPYGGPRNNPRTLFHMTSEKASGVISAIQETLDGPVEWIFALPNTCNLSYGLKKLVEPLLAGLLESNRLKMITFEKFFSEVETICRKFLVPVFNFSTSELLHVFCDQDTFLSEFRVLLEQQTDLDARNQLIIYENCALVDKDGQTSQTIRLYHSMSSANPFFLFSTIRCPVLNPFSPILPDEPEMSKKIEAETDSSTASRVCSHLYYFSRIVSDSLLRQQLIQKATKMFLFILCQKIAETKEHINQLRCLVEEFLKRIDLLLNNYDLIMMISKIMSEKLISIDQESMIKLSEYKWSALEIKKVVEKMDVDIVEFQHETNDDNFLLSWIDQSGCQDSDFCSKKIEILVNTAVEIEKEFREKLKWMEFSHNEKQIHQLGKQRMKNDFKKGRLIIENHCLPNSICIYEKAMEWYQEIQKLHSEINKLNKVAQNTSESLTHLTNNVDQLQIDTNDEFAKLSKSVNAEIVSLSELITTDGQQERCNHSLIENEFVFLIERKLFRKLKIPYLLSGMDNNSNGIANVRQKHEKKSVESSIPVIGFVYEEHEEPRTLTMDL